MSDANLVVDNSVTLLIKFEPESSFWESIRANICFYQSTILLDNLENALKVLEMDFGKRWKSSVAKMQRTMQDFDGLPLGILINCLSQHRWSSTVVATVMGICWDVFWMLERNYTCMPNGSQCGKTSFGNKCSTRIRNNSAVEYALSSEGLPGRLICAEKGTEGLNKAARSPVHLSLFKASCQHSTVSGPHSVLMGLHITAPLKSFNPCKPRDMAGVLVRVRLFTYFASSSELCGWWWRSCCKQMGCRQPPQY